MTEEQEVALRASPVFWLEAQIEAILGHKGDDYWCEPVTVYAVLSDLLKVCDEKIKRAQDALK